MNLKTIIQDILQDAEQLLGKKCDDWTFYDEIKFKEGPPYIQYFPDTKCVSIVLSKSVEGDEYRTIAQLSHEIGHIISPVKLPNNLELLALNIHEGLAEYVSLIYLCKWSGLAFKEIYQTKKELNGEYLKALNAVLHFISKDTEYFKKLRSKVPILSNLTIDDFTATDDSEIKDAQFLLSKF